MLIILIPSIGLVDATTFKEFAEPGTNFIIKFQFLNQDRQTIYNLLSEKKLTQKEFYIGEKIAPKIIKRNKITPDVDLKDVSTQVHGRKNP